MTYCCGILVRDGLVMIADTRTNAGLDNVSTFRKLHVFAQPGERIMAVASAGNLAISQSVISTLTEGIEDAMSAHAQTGVPVWAAMDAGKLAAVQLPFEVGEVVIFADRDKPQARYPQGIGVGMAHPGFASHQISGSGR